MEKTKTIQKSPLPSELQLHDVPVAEALTAICARLVEIAEALPLVSDIDLDLSIDPNGRCACHFRACR
jgi:hypothetical protein